MDVQIIGFGCLMPALSAHTGDCYSAPPCPFQVLDLEILMLYDVTSEDINTSRPLLRHQFFTFMLILVTSTSMFTKHETNGLRPQRKGIGELTPEGARAMGPRG